MKNTAGESASIRRISRWFTASQTFAYSVTGRSSPVTASFFRCVPSAATE